jgi:hypothetical protein
VRREGLELVGGGYEGQAGVRRDLARDRDVEALLGVEARAHRGAALREAEERGEGALDALDAVGHLRSISFGVSAAVVLAGRLLAAGPWSAGSQGRFSN